jgi:hypothetical protein
MNTYLLNYRCYGKGQQFLRGGFAVRVAAKSNGEAIETLEADLKRRFKNINYMVCDSCVLEKANDFFLRAKAKLENKCN